MKRKKQSHWKKKLKWLGLLVIVLAVAFLASKMDVWVPSTHKPAVDSPDKTTYDALKSECDAAYNSQIMRGVRPVRYLCEQSDIVTLFVKQYGRQPNL